MLVREHERSKALRGRHPPLELTVDEQPLALTVHTRGRLHCRPVREFDGCHSAKGVLLEREPDAQAVHGRRMGRRVVEDAVSIELPALDAGWTAHRSIMHRLRKEIG